MLPVPVMEAVVSRATPKSMIFTEPSVWMKILAGLMSRWTIPAWWAWASPASTCTMTATLRSAAMGGCWRTAFWRSCPFRSSMAMTGEPSVWSKRSKTVTTFGWVILATARASRAKRCFSSGSSAMFATMTLRATSRSRIVSWAT